MRNAVANDELETLAESWLAMAQATTLDAIEAATLECILKLIDVEVAYTARLENAVWRISEEVGLIGDVAGMAVPEAFVPYAGELRAGRTVAYENAIEMGPDLAGALAAVGIGSVFAVPIMRDETCVGALVIGQRTAFHFSDRDRALVRLFTSHLSALIGKRESLGSLETLSESVPVIVLRTDPSGWING
jgi:GAF domain-containing protein